MLRQQARLLELSLEPILAWELGGAITYWNAGAASLYGYTAEEAVGRRSHELLATVCLASDPDFEDAVAREGRWMGELVHTTRDGRKVVVESRQELMRQDGDRPPLVLETNRDVTMRKETERQLREARDAAERANAAKSRFLAAASHDLRQPLQAIDLHRAILTQRAAGDPLMARTLADLGSSIDAMRNTLDALLDLSRLETGAVPVVTSEFALHEVFNLIAGEFRGLAAAKGLALRVLPTSAVVRADRRLLERIVQNLVANATKYTHSGRILVGCRRRGDRVAVEVWDTGIGIADDRIDSIFEEFFQIGNPAREQRFGLGLGLSIARAAAELLQTRIYVRSLPGRGSVFGFAVPVVGAERPATLRRRPVLAPDVAPTPVMVVEDDGPIRSGLQALLELDGHEVLAFATGDAALAAVRQGHARPALLIADQNLAGSLPGSELVEALRALLAPTPLPALLITGDVLPERVARFAGAGVPHLTKPVDLAELRRMIGQLVTNVGGKDGEVVSPRHRPGAAATGPAVFIVEDDPREGKALLALVQAAGLPARLYHRAEDLLAEHTPSWRGCALIDIGLPGMSGLDLQRELARRGDLPCVLLTGRGEIAHAIQALRAGAVDFMVKPVGGEALLASIRRAIEAGRGASARIPILPNDDLLERLTHRERTVVALIGEGLTNKQVAFRLGISQRTVEGHRARAMAKLGVRSLSELIRLLLAAGGARPA